MGLEAVRVDLYGMPNGRFGVLPVPVEHALHISLGSVGFGQAIVELQGPARRCARRRRNLFHAEWTEYPPHPRPACAAAYPGSI